MTASLLRMILALVLGWSCVGGSLALGADDPQTGASDVIVIFGASYAKDWHIESIAGAKVTNSGIGGNETKDMLARYERDVLSLSPDKVIFWGFINDFMRSNAQQAGQVSSLVKERYQTMVDTALQRGIEPVLATEVTLPAATTWWGEIIAWVFRLIGRKGYADRINTNVMEVNAWLKDFARQRSLPLLDLQAALAPGGFYRKRAFSQPDGSHLSEAAYRELTSYTRAHEGSLRK